MKSPTLLAVILSGLISSPAVASDEAADAAAKTIPLQDGATLYVFKDGKMAMANKYGRAVSMKEGEVMTTKDGREVIMVGNQFAYLERLINRGHRGGGGR